MDKVTERRHYLNQPVIARYVRFHPIAWHKRIGLRAGVIGCKHTGDCGPGFMRVNTGSLCSKFLLRSSNNSKILTNHGSPQWGSGGQLSLWISNSYFFGCLFTSLGARSGILTPCGCLFSLPSLTSNTRGTPHSCR